MRHFFISPAAVHSPRWQQAFPAARLLDSPTELSPLSADDTVWLLIDDTTDSALAACVALNARVVALTRFEDAAEAQWALAEGACGYLHYLATPAVLAQVLDDIPERDDIVRAMAQMPAHDLPLPDI